MAVYALLSWWSALFAVAIGFWILIGFPFALAGIVSAFGSQLAIRGNCRSPMWAHIGGLIVSLATYATIMFLDFRGTGTFHLSSHMFELPGQWQGAIVVEAITVIGLATFWTGSAIRNVPYCESCKNWYDVIETRRIPMELAEPLLLTLNSGSMRLPVEVVSSKTILDLPNLQIEFKRCHKCNDSDHQLSVSLHWQEKDDAGKRSLNSADWLKTMVPPTLAMEIEELLFKETETKPSAQTS